MLELHAVSASYGDASVLRDVSLRVAAGEAVCLLGRNGAGKTTTLKAIMGYLPPSAGRILWHGNSIVGQRPFRIARAGFGFVPQERGIFPSLSVRENLTTTARGRSGGWGLKEVFAMFPRLEERQANLGDQLSGGEQQMLSIARAMMTNPAILLLDEPSEGLAPILVREILDIMRRLKGEGLAILLVEQNLRAALWLGDRHVVLSKGEVCFAGTTAELEGNEAVVKEHLGV